MRKVVRIGGGAGCHAGELGRYRLAQNDRAGSTQERNAGGIAGGPVAAVDRRAHLGRKVGGIEHVLDADRHAMQHAAGRAAVEVARMRERKLGVEACEGMHRAFARRDAIEAGAHNGFCGEFSRYDAAGDFGGGELVEFALSIGRSPLTPTFSPTEVGYIRLRSLTRLVEVGYIRLRPGSGSAPVAWVARHS